MAIRKKTKELKRLQRSFEQEADRYHDLALSIHFITDFEEFKDKDIKDPNHLISLWQYYGKVESEESIEKLFYDMHFMKTDYGIFGAKFSAFAVIEGEKMELFKRMGDRAGSLFSDKEVSKIDDLTKKDLITDDEPGKPVYIRNPNPLAVWINFVLYHLSISHPMRFKSTKLAVDPFTASLRAIDHLLEEKTISRSLVTYSAIEKKKFDVALSYPGEKRDYVESVAADLVERLGEGSIFYDAYYQAQLARPNLDIMLQKVYHDNGKLIVVFLCK